MKSPVASLCFVCSSVKNLVKVMISVLIASPTAPPLLCSLPLIVVSMIACHSRNVSINVQSSCVVKPRAANKEEDGKVVKMERIQSVRKDRDHSRSKSIQAP